MVNKHFVAYFAVDSENNPLIILFVNDILSLEVEYEFTDSMNLHTINIKFLSFSLKHALSKIRCCTADQSLGTCLTLDDCITLKHLT